MKSTINFNKITKPLLDQTMDGIFHHFFNLEKFLDDTDMHVKEWVIIKLVTVIEQFCRQIVSNQIDTHPDIQLPETFQLDITDFDRAKDISSSFLIASQYNFQNTRTIINYLNNYKINNVFDTQNKNEIEELFNVRHNIVHTTSTQNYDIKKGYHATQKLLKSILEKSSFDLTYYDIIHGNYFAGIEKFDDALNCYENAIKINPADTMVHYYIGLIHCVMHDIDAAHDRSITMIHLDPDDLNAYYLKGLIFIEQEKYPDTIDCCNKIIKSDPDHIDAHYQKGFALQKLNKIDEVLLCGYEIIRLDPTYNNILLSMAHILNEINRYPESLIYLDWEIYLHPNNADAYYEKYVTLYHLNKLDESKKYLNEAIKIKPDGDYQVIHSNDKKRM